MDFQLTNEEYKEYRNKRLEREDLLENETKKIAGSLHLVLQSIRKLKNDFPEIADYKEYLQLFHKVSDAVEDASNLSEKFLEDL